MPRMRTIREAYREIRKQDPDSAISMNGLRSLVLSGQIPSRRLGVKYLVDLDAVERYFGYAS